MLIPYVAPPSIEDQVCAHTFDGPINPETTVSAIVHQRMGLFFFIGIGNHALIECGRATDRRDGGCHGQDFDFIVRELKSRIQTPFGLSSLTDQRVLCI